MKDCTTKYKFLEEYGTHIMELRSLTDISMFLYQTFRFHENDIQPILVDFALGENAVSAQLGMLTYCLEKNLIDVHSFFLLPEPVYGKMLEINLVILDAGKSYIHDDVDISTL